MNKHLEVLKALYYNRQHTAGCDCKDCEALRYAITQLEKPRLDRTEIKKELSGILAYVVENTIKDKDIDKIIDEMIMPVIDKYRPRLKELDKKILEKIICSFRGGPYCGDHRGCEGLTNAIYEKFGTARKVGVEEIEKIILNYHRNTLCNNKPQWKKEVTQAIHDLIYKGE